MWVVLVNELNSHGVCVLHVLSDLFHTNQIMKGLLNAQWEVAETESGSY